ncbi:hypothetical protein ABEB36_014381 [Hypothenemus hampei]|uniref:Prefoldin subunit 4 n=1 Tax=Hypothenemus hampei TaxID=57062 RepID=A0ABD1E6F5_HYPHA
MAATNNKSAFQPDSDAHISYEDQQKINAFARCHAKFEDLKDEVQVKENDLKTLEDACDEIALFDDDQEIPYLFGEVFIYQNLETTLKCLEEAKERLSNEITNLKTKSEEIKDQMSDLKLYLYGKFGNQINLESDE